MRGGTFFGGIHPRYEKELASGRAVETTALPERLVVPLAQNLGAAPKPIVKKGDAVKRGELIAEPQGFVSVPLHAPTSGSVQAIDIFPHPVGADLPAIVIVPDGADEWAPGCNEERGDVDIDAAAVRDIIRDSGLVGMGGAAFPTHVKLSPPKDKPVDCLILNGAECEPYLTADHRLMVEHPAEILEGASFLAGVLGVSNVIVAVEKNKPDAIEALRQPAAQRGYSMRACDVVYPQGAERQLVFALTGRRVPAGGLPMDVGVLVQNVGTCYAAFEAVRWRRPLIERVVCVTGRGVSEPKNLRLRIGTTFRDAIERCGGLREDAGKIIGGGPMMGVAQYSLDAPVTKGTSGIVVLPRGEAVQYEGDPCIRCGRCLRACPMLLNPSLLSVYAERLRFDDMAAHSVLDCIECGCCAYVCPSRRPMVHHFRRAKAEIRKKKTRTA